MLINYYQKREKIVFCIEKCYNLRHLHETEGPKIKSSSVETEELLTIACHMKILKYI